jgi:hypothetical protein
LDKSKKGTDPINIKTREVIRYLDRRSKSHQTRAADSTPSGSLRIQTPEELFQNWDDCEKLSTKIDEEYLSKDEIPRHFRAMANCVLFHRSKGNELWVVSEDADLVSFVERWNIKTMTIAELDSMSSEAMAKYHREIKAYEARKRTSSRTNQPKQRTIWAPQK